MRSAHLLATSRSLLTPHTVSALVAPFFASSLLARFWPAIRGLWLTAKGRLQQAWDTRGGGGGAAETSEWHRFV